MINAHDIDYKVLGHGIQLVEIELDPNETVIAEAGSMMYMSDGIRFETRMGDGSEPNQGLFGKLMQGAQRVLSGESLFLTHFTNAGYGKQHVAFSAPYPGTIVPIFLPDYNGRIIAQKDAFLAAALGTKLSIVFNKRLGAGFFGGEGFIMEKLEGNGKVLLHACGTVVERELNGETLRVDTGAVVALTDGIDFNIERAGNLRSMVFGGEGLFLTTLRGHGKVWLQSMPVSKLIRQLSSFGGNRNKEGGAWFSNFME